MDRKRYPSDLTDAQWAKIEPFMPEPVVSGRTGRPRKYIWREIVNAMFYHVRSGCPWEMLPHDLPQWNSVYGYFRLWRQDGTFERIHDTLREQVRLKAGKEATPSAAIIDSQSVKTTEKGGSAATTPARRSRAGNDTSS